jgi:hypothetical protein
MNALGTGVRKESSFLVHVAMPFVLSGHTASNARMILGDEEEKVNKSCSDLFKALLYYLTES